jgi:DNA-binding NarL/FixJ family response regulator
LQPFRVLTGELPGILNDLIGTLLEAEGDIRVIGKARNRSELRELTRRVRPDVIIIGVEEPNATAVGWDLYAGDPLVRVLGVVGEGRQTFVYELRLHRTALGELSPQELIAAVRRMAHTRSASQTGSGSPQ